MPRILPTGLSLFKPFAMAISPETQSAEVFFYGEVVKKRPKDDNGKPSEDAYIVESEVLEALDAIAASGAKSLFMRLNSVGGECFSAITIFNRLIELKRTGCFITAQPDGVSMSAAFFIMQAADVIRVFDSSLLMMHMSSVCVLGYYNSLELSKVSGQLDGCDTAMVSAIKRKTGKGEREIVQDLQAETYMTGSEAVERGYADELVEDEDAMPVAASANRDIIFAYGREIKLPKGYKLPEGLDVELIDQSAVDALFGGGDSPLNTVTTSDTEDKTNTQPVITGANTKGGKKMATTLAELRSENNALAEQLMTEARAEVATESAAAVETARNEERARIQQIDSIAAQFSAETVDAAKYTQPCTAQEMAFRAAQAAAKKGGAFLSDMDEDAKGSGASGVGAIPPPDDDAGGDGLEDVKAIAKATVEEFRKMKEGK